MRTGGRARWTTWLCAVVLLVGCRTGGGTPPRVETTPPLESEFAAGQRALLAGYPAVAYGHFDIHRARVSKTAERAEADYWLGLCELKMNHPERALVWFDQALAEGPEPEVRGLALLAKTLACYRLNRLREALETCRQLEETAVGSVPADEVLYRKALILRRQGRWEEANRAFRELALRHPDSPRAQAARREGQRRQHWFTCQIGWFHNRRNAENLVSAARRMGFDARIEAGTRRGGRGFAVVVGRFIRYADARRARENLERAGFQAFVSP